MKRKIAAVVVTYNRKQFLINCLHAIEMQTEKPSNVYILDNASTDGTEQLLENEGYIDTVKNGIRFIYILNERNEGGAGGFYKGMYLAFNSDFYDALWVMDDDGVPNTNCLELMTPYLDRYDYISPLSVSSENSYMTSFMGYSVEEFRRRAVDGIVNNEANPFNGILYSNKLIEQIGFPKKEMFIWGDEINYDLRAKQAGFIPIVVIDAIHYHPINRQQSDYYWGKHTLTVSDKDWKLFCFLRNQTYNTKLFSSRLKCIKSILCEIVKYICYFVYKKHTVKKITLVLEAVYKGYMEDFSGMEKYMSI